MKNYRFKMHTILLGLFATLHLVGQSKLQTIEVSKGEVLDILLISQKEDVDNELQDYFKVAFPVAKRFSYQNQPGFKVTEHNEGNLRPGALILGKWDGIKEREDFLDQITLEVPSFHQRRRTIWDYFGLRYYEAQEDFKIEIDRSKFHVANAFWLKKGMQEHRDEIHAWSEAVSKKKGQCILKLSGGKSPFGYQYNPDFFFITSWENEEAYLSFQREKADWNLEQIQHINEFVIE